MKFTSAMEDINQSLPRKVRFSSWNLVAKFPINSDLIRKLPVLSRSHLEASCSYYVALSVKSPADLAYLHFLFPNSIQNSTKAEPWTTSRAPYTSSRFAPAFRRFQMIQMKVNDIKAKSVARNAAINLRKGNNIKANYLLFMTLH